jgi:hypothetical protein
MKDEADPMDPAAVAQLMDALHEFAAILAVVNADSQGHSFRIQLCRPRGQAMLLGGGCVFGSGGEELIVRGRLVVEPAG